MARITRRRATARPGKTIRSNDLLLRERGVPGGIVLTSETSPLQVEFDTIGKYKVLLELGRGSIGVVYKAHDPGLNRFAAIKMISPSLAATAATSKRFLRRPHAA